MNIFTHSKASVWSILWLLISVFTYQNIKKELFIFIYKGFRKPENTWLAPRLLPLPEVIGFVLGFGFGSCFAKCELSDFVSVPVLELFRTSWLHSSFVCSLPKGSGKVTTPRVFWRSRQLLLNKIFEPNTPMKKVDKGGKGSEGGGVKKKIMSEKVANNNVQWTKTVNCTNNQLQLLWLQSHHN